MEERMWVTPLFIILVINAFIVGAHFSLSAIDPSYGLTDSLPTPPNFGSVTFDRSTGKYNAPETTTYVPDTASSASFISTTGKTLSDLLTGITTLQTNISNMFLTIQLLLFGLPILMSAIGIPLWIVYVFSVMFGLLYIFAVLRIIISVISAIRGGS